MKYSIIIPVYNAEATLKRCLDSVLTQDYPDAELLLINDGSTDRSEEICREYAERYPNVVCYSQPNAGVSAARNLGLDQAKGTYILFVDSDDYVEPDYFQKLDRLLEDSDPELVFFSYRLVGESASLRLMPEAVTHDKQETIQYIASFLRKRSKGALWAKVFLRDIIEANNLRFDQTLNIDEDVCFVFSYAMHVARIKSTGTILYSNSIDNSESLTRRKRDYLCSQLHHAGLTRYKIASEASLSVPVQRVLQRSLSWLYYRAAYSSAAELLKYDLCRKERIARIKEICAVFSDYPEKSVKPVISIPVRLKMAWLIDCAARYAVQRRKF